VESLILAAIDLTTILTWAKNLGMVAIGLGFVIFVHELGHFLVAKACGVKCEKFYIGFNFFDIPLGFVTIPRTLFKVQWGETEYGIGSFPLGGYVKMLGQDDNPNNAETESDRTKVRDDAGNVQLDPRSYTAKSVPQRMAIISAGVIMNIIFGVIFAAIAYRVGVNIHPAVIGTTAPGDPAWKANLQTGDRVLSLTRTGYKNEHLRFVEDMTKDLVLYHTFDQDLDLQVRRANGEDEIVTLRPSDRHSKSKDLPARPTLGVSQCASLEFRKLSAEELALLGRDLSNISYDDKNGTKQLSEFADLQSAIQSHAALQVRLTSKIGPGDKLLEIDDQPVSSYADVQRLLAARPYETIKLTIQRAAKKDAKEEANATTTAPPPETYTLEVSPRPAVDYGLVMEMSPISAIQKGSPAAEAGLAADDRLVSFAGEPIGDPLAFPQKTLARIGQRVDVEVERTEDGKKVAKTIQVALRAPRQTTWSGTASNMIAVETMGIAYEVSTKVATVRDDGPAAGKLQPGDNIRKVQFVPAGDAQETLEGSLYPKPAMAKEAIELDGKMAGWPRIIEHASTLRLRDTGLLATVARGDEVIEVKLWPADSKEIFIDDRGLEFRPLQETHVAAGWGEAFSLGAREVKERMSEVLTVVRKLVTGRMSPKMLGGPLTIIGAATVEADRGITDLLMFYTFLSANLAVVNFLPIPALDGGHMVFLAYEGIRRKPVDPDLQIKLSAAGILSLLALMLGVTIMDLYRWFG
jgi:regulator of sigma E protease